MGWFLWLSLLVLLLLSYFDQRKNIDIKTWLAIIGIFLLCNFYVNLFGILIPAGVIIGMVYVKKRKKPYLSKALIFGFICVISSFYTPNFDWSQLKEHFQDAKYSAEFSQVNGVSHFSASSEINVNLHKSAVDLQDKNPISEIKIEDPHVLFSIWALSHKSLPMKDLDWLWYKSPQELHYYWQSNRPDEFTNMEYIIFNDVGYMGIFQRVDKNSQFILRTIYEFDRLKMNNPLIP